MNELQMLNRRRYFFRAKGYAENYGGTVDGTSFAVVLRLKKGE